MTELEELIEPSTEKQPAHYVNNKQFFEALVEYRNQVEDAKKNGLPKPQVSNYIGECFLKIATHLSYKANFINYTFKDDMISDGIENCLTAVEKFDPSRSTNPFAYYTQIIYFAFVRRIQKEKKQQATKYKLLENIDIDQLVAQSEDGDELVTHLMEMARKQMDTVDPERRNIKPAKKKGKNIPESIDDTE